MTLYDRILGACLLIIAMTASATMMLSLAWLVWLAVTGGWR